MRPIALALSLTLLFGCRDGVRRPEPVGTPSTSTYALAYPHELERVSRAYEAGRLDTLQHCGDAVELLDTVKDPVDAEFWESILVAAEANGASRFYAARVRENAIFGQVLREGDNEITKRTAGAAQFTAEQKGCPIGPEISGATAGTLRRVADKRIEDRLHDASDATAMMRGRQDALGKGNLAPIAKQADLIAYASFMMALELPTLAYDRDRLADESPKVKHTLDRLVVREREHQGRAGVTDADKKTSDERIRELEAAKALVVTQESQLEGAAAKVEAELRDTRENCRDILDAIRTAIAKRRPK